MGRKVPMFLVVVFGLIGVVIFGYYALIDWNALQQAYVNFANLTQNPTNFSALFAAEAQQNIHRINLFAEGVWTLQSAILAAIGMHGIYTAPKNLTRAS